MKTVSHAAMPDFRERCKAPCQLADRNVEKNAVEIFEKSIRNGLSGGFVKIGEITLRSVFIQRKREGNGGSRLLHSPSRQPRDAITNLALRNRLKIIEVCRARVRKSVLLGKDEFRGNASDCR